jgi:glycosyltransferase involved in cell wall biosynthesis
MTSSPVVSVVLPIFNGGKLLRTSIESVLAQSYEDFELMLWDDASTDESWDVACSYVDKRIRRHRQSRNVGLFRNLNDAIRQASGELVRLWSQDDRMKPICLAREHEFWKSHPDIGMFYCAVECIDVNGRRLASGDPDTTPDVISPRLADEISFNWGSMPGNISTVTIPRTVLQRVGDFECRLLLAADFEMWTRIQATYPIGFCNEALIELRRHSGQLSRSRGADLVFLRECHEIYEVIERRLPAAERRARGRYSKFVHCTPYFQAAVAALCRGNWRHAADLAREIHKWQNIFGVATRWLVTLNGRLYRPEPVYSRESRLELTPPA